MIPGHYNVIEPNIVQILLTLSMIYSMCFKNFPRPKHQGSGLEVAVNINSSALKAPMPTNKVSMLKITINDNNNNNIRR